jgi:hypothetical protein
MLQESTVKRSSIWRAGGLALSAALAAGLAISACSSGSSVSGTSNGTNYSAAAGKLPAGFPSDIPTPSNSRVLGGGGVGSNWNVAFALTGSVNDGFNSYQDKFRSEGYTVTDSSSGTGTGGATGATFTANNSKWTVHVAGGSSPSSASGGSLKSGEFPLNVTATPAS